MTLASISKARIDTKSQAYFLKESKGYPTEHLPTNPVLFTQVFVITVLFNCSNEKQMQLCNPCNKWKPQNSRIAIFGILFFTVSCKRLSAKWNFHELWVACWMPVN